MTGSEPQEAAAQDRGGLIATYTPLVKMIAVKIVQRVPPNVELDDLLSAGTIGLIDAIEKYDRAKSDNFKKYAEIRIKGAILDELRAMDHVSRTVRRQTTSLEDVRRGLQATLERAPTDSEMAEALGVDIDAYHGMRNKLKPISVVGFEDLSRGDAGEQRDVLQLLPDPNAVDPRNVLQIKMLRELVEVQIRELKERERVVVSLYYLEDLNLKEIGKILSVTESRVSQVLKEATERLKRRVRRHFSDDDAETNQLG